MSLLRDLMTELNKEKLYQQAQTIYKELIILKIKLTDIDYENSFIAF